MAKAEITYKDKVALFEELVSTNPEATLKCDTLA